MSNMDISQLITFCKLKGTIDVHEQNAHNEDFWRMRLRFDNKIITFQYYKSPRTKELMFCEGRLSTSEGKLGTCSSEIHDFKHLMKLL